MISQWSEYIPILANQFLWPWMWDWGSQWEIIPSCIWIAPGRILLQSILTPFKMKDWNRLWRKQPKSSNRSVCVPIWTCGTCILFCTGASSLLSKPLLDSVFGRIFLPTVYYPLHSVPFYSLSMTSALTFHWIYSHATLCIMMYFNIYWYYKRTSFIYASARQNASIN
jgi:hypothetical protein